MEDGGPSKAVGVTAKQKEEMREKERKVGHFTCFAISLHNLGATDLIL